MLKFGQLNCHKTVTAASNLANDVGKAGGLDVVFLQEPPFAKKLGKVLGFKGLEVQADTTTNIRPRAALALSKGVDAWRDSKFCPPDLATAVIQLQDGRALYVASAYMDI